MAKKTSHLKVIAVEHGESGKITAFFNELPGLVVQGDSEDDVRVKLRAVLVSYIERLQSGKNDFTIERKTITA